jgi:hypothetical protein
VNKRICFFLLAALVLLAFGCKTAPKPVEVEEPAAPAAPLPEAEYKQAQELRALIGKYELDQYAPDVYKTADARFVEGEKAYRKDNVLSKAALTDAIAGYQKVIDTGFPKVVAASQQEAEAAKAEAEELGAPVANKSAFDEAVDTFNQAVKARDAKEYETSLELFAKAKDQFEGSGGVAKQKKDRAERAYLDAQAAKKEADDLKSAVAVKGPYAAALDTYNQGLRARQAKDYDRTFDLMQKARGQFTAVAETARKKRANAEEAVADSEAEIKTAEQQATEADQILAGGE